MKKKFKRFGKSSLSFVLSLLLIVSTLIVGNIGSIDASAKKISTNNLSGIYLSGTMNGWDVSDDWKFDNVIDTNHRSATFYLPYSADDYDFKVRGVYTPSGDAWRSFGGVTFDSSNTVYCNNSSSSSDGKTHTTTSDGANDKIKCITATSGYIKLTSEVYCEYSSDVYLKIEQSAVPALATTINNVTNNQELDAGDTITLASTESGGSGSYTHTYTATLNGTDVTSSVISGNVFTAPSVASDSTYVITDTMSDADSRLSGLTNATSSVNVVVKSSVIEAHDVSVVAKQGSTTTTKAAVTLTAGDDSITNGETISEVTTPATVTAAASYTDNGTTYYFTGWSVEGTGTGTFGTPSATTSTFIPSGTNVTAVANYSTGFSVTVNTPTNGILSVDKKTAPSGQTVRITMAPKTNFKLTSLAITNSSTGASIATLNQDDNFTAGTGTDVGTYYCDYTMPASNITLTATFTQVSRRVYFYNRFNWPADQIRAYAYLDGSSPFQQNAAWASAPSVVAEESNEQLLYYDVDLNNGSLMYNKIIFYININGCAQTANLDVPAIDSTNEVFVPKYDENQTSGAWTTLSNYSSYTFTGDDAEENFVVIYMYDGNKAQWGNDKTDGAVNRCMYWSTSEDSTVSNYLRMTRVPYESSSSSNTLYKLLIKQTSNSALYNILTGSGNAYVRFCSNPSYLANEKNRTLKNTINKNNVNQVYYIDHTASENNWSDHSGQTVWDGGWNNISVYINTAESDDITPESNQLRVYAKTGTVRDSNENGVDYSYDKYSFLSDITKFEYSDGTSITTYDRNTYTVPTSGVRVKLANVDKETPFKVQVTVKDEYKNKYYIKGFDINGYTFNVISEAEARTMDGVYTCEYTIPYKATESVEITPIYYYFTSDTSTDWNYKENFVTFSAEDFNGAVRDEWGGTIACYAYYSSTTEGYHHFDKQVKSSVSRDPVGQSAMAGYPGQPMVYEDGSYFMQLPKKLYDGSGNAVADIEGITMNNYIWDNVHGANIKGCATTTQKEGANCQTYDYDDFSAILERGSNKIIFSFKYRTADSTKGTENPDQGNKPREINQLNISDFTSKNGWDVLVDYYNIPVDLFANRLVENGSYISESTVKNKADTDKIYVVSEGYYNYYRGSEEYLGRFATRWYVYKYDSDDQKYNYVGALPPSAFLSDCIKSSYDGTRDLTVDDIDDTKYLKFAQSTFSSPYTSSANYTTNKAEFVNLYNACKGIPTVITYESAITSRTGLDYQTNASGNNPGYRCDGRWYYSIPRSQIDANVIIQIVDENGNYTDDNFTDATSHTGGTTNANAYFTNRSLDVNGNSYYGKTSTTVLQDEDSKFYLVADAYSEKTVGNTTNSYTFQGWYYNSGSSVYNPMNVGVFEKYVTGERAMNAPSTFIAVYKKLDVGVEDTTTSRKRCLVVSHDMYENADSIASDPSVHNGSGEPYVKVEIYDSTGTTRKAIYQSTKGAVPVELDLTEYADGDKVRITLTTNIDSETELVDIFRKETSGFSKSGVSNSFNSESNSLSKTAGITGNPTTENNVITAVYEYSISGITFDNTTHIAKFKYYTDTITQGNIEIHYMYYDRDTSQHSKPMTMSTTATEIVVYASPNKTVGETTTTTLANAISNGLESEQTTVVVNGQEKTINSNVLSQLDNVIDTYSFWTSQDAAETGIANQPNYRDSSIIKDENGAPVLTQDGNQTYKNYAEAYATEINDNENFLKYHTNAYGVPVTASTEEGKADENKWVTYTTLTNSNPTAYYTSQDSGENALNLKTIKSVTVWLYNTPKKYDIHVYVPEFDAEGALITSNSKFVGSDDIYYNAASFSHKFGFYNQRLGEADPINGGTDSNGNAIGSDGQCDYLKDYGILTGYVGGDMTAPDVDGYDFVGWYAMDDDENLKYKITSEKTYGYRITSAEEITACYKAHTNTTLTDNTPTISVSNGGIEYYVNQTSAGANADLNVRLNTQLNVSYPGDFQKSDTNIKQYSAIIIKLPVVDADGNAIQWTPERLAELEEADVYEPVIDEETGEQVIDEETGEGKTVLTEDNTDLRSAITAHLNSITNSAAVNGRGSFVIRIDDLKFNRKGGINSFTYDVKWEDGDATSTEVKLTNKNRIMFTLPMKAELYQGGANSALMSYAAIYYDDGENDAHWILSDNYVPFVYSDN